MPVSMIDRIVGHPDAAYLARLPVLAALAVEAVGQRFGRRRAMLLQFPQLNVAFFVCRVPRMIYVICLN